jgi:hypothetical protein
VALDKTVAQPHLETTVVIASVEEQPSRCMPGLVIGGNIKDFDAHDSLSSIRNVAPVLRHAFLRPASYQAGVRAASLLGASVPVKTGSVGALGRGNRPQCAPLELQISKDIDLRCYLISTLVNE